MAYSTAAGAEGWPMDLSEYAFELVRSDEALALHRGRSGTPSSRRPILLLTPLSGHPAPATLERLGHEYSLAPALCSAWTARPIALTEHQDQIGRASCRE